MNSIALILDGEVVDIIRVEDRLAAILLSDPEIVDVTDLNASSMSVMVGHKYDPNTQKFSAE